MRVPHSALIIGVLAGACVEPPLDTTRQVKPRGTLGEEIYGLLHRDFVREAPRVAQGFEGQRDGFVRGVDHLFPQSELTEVQAFFEATLSLHDDGTMPGYTRRIADITRRLTADPEATRSLTALLNRIGYVDPLRQHALTRRISGYDDYDTLARASLDLLLAHDGLDDAGAPDDTEDDTIGRLLETAAESLATVEISESEERDIVIFADLLLSEDPRIATRPAPGNIARIVRRDARGMATVRTTGAAVPAPFVDTTPADGRPDIDDAGRFVDVNGDPLDLSPFGRDGRRDQAHRVVAADGARLLYDYANLDQTIVAGLLRDTRTLVNRGVPMKGVRTLEAFLGTRTPAGTYSAVNNPLMDAAHALAETLDDQDLPELLEVLRLLLERHEGPLAEVALQLQRQLEIADTYDVNLATGSTFFDDMMSVIRKILREPRLLEDLLDALDDPDILKFPEASATLAQWRKVPIRRRDVTTGDLFSVPVDRSQPDLRPNQSHHQRLMHLIFDTRGARYEPRFAGVPLGFVFEIDDIAEFYILSIIGESEVPALVSTLTGLSQRPTPVELAEFINTDQTFGNAEGRAGIPVKDNDGDALFAASASGMTDALAPLVRVFHRHDKLDLLFELFEILHLHWASSDSDFQSTNRRQPRYSKLSGIRYYEPLMIDVYRNATVLAATRDLLQQTRQLTTASGRSARAVLLAFARKVIAKDSTLTTRDGKREVLVGRDRISPLSPFDLIRGALDSLEAVTRRRARTQREFDEVADALTDVFAGTERGPSGAAQLENRRAIPILSAVLDLVIRRARKRPVGEIPGWIRTQLPELLEDLITSETLPEILDLIHLIEADPRLEPALVELRDQLLDEDDGFPDLLSLVGDASQAAKDASVGAPFLRFMGGELDPQRGLVFASADLTRALLDRDESDRILLTARRGIEETPDGELYIDGILRAFKQISRVNPLDTGSVDVDDTRAVITKTGDYLLDREDGLEKYYDLVQRRTGDSP